MAWNLLPAHLADLQEVDRDGPPLPFHTTDLHDTFSTHAIPRLLPPKYVETPAGAVGRERHARWLGGVDMEVTSLPKNTPDSASRTAFAFVVHWPLTGEGGVNGVVVDLIEQCRRSDRFQPILFESSWEHREPTVSRRFGIPLIRFRWRAPVYQGTIRELLTYLLFLPGQLRRLRELSKRHRIATWNIHFPGAEGLTIILLQKLGWYRGKLILSFHGSDIREILRSRGLKRWLTRWVVRHADAVTPCSKGLLEEVLMLDSGLTNGHPILNGINPLGLAAEPVIPREDDTELIVSIGRFEYRKGHDLLIAAFQELAKRRQKARLWIIGTEGDELASTRWLAESDPRIRLLLNVPHARAMATIAQGDIFAFSSRWRRGEFGEGLPLALLEAGRLALPVVSTRCCGAAELIPNSEFGTLVDLENPRQLAQAMEELLADPDRARDIALRLQERIAEQFTWKSAWLQYESLAGEEEA